MASEKGTATVNGGHARGEHVPHEALFGVALEVGSGDGAAEGADEYGNVAVEVYDERDERAYVQGDIKGEAVDVVEVEHAACEDEMCR